MLDIPNDDDSDDSEESNSNVEQSKSLIAEAYSTAEDDKYSDISDWEMTEEELDIGYGVTSPQNGSGEVKNAAKQMAPSGSHREWYTGLQYALAHVVSEQVNVPEIEQSDIEPQGVVPLFEHLRITMSDIVEFVTSEETELDVTADQVSRIIESETELRQQFFRRMDELEGVEVEEELYDGLDSEEDSGEDDEGE